MTQFDHEMLTFKEIIHRYKPIEGYHLVLDLADYKSGKKSLLKYKFGCSKYRHYINSECHEKNIDIVIITSNMSSQITYISKFLYAKYCYNLKEPCVKKWNYFFSNSTIHSRLSQFVNTVLIIFSSRDSNRDIFLNMYLEGSVQNRPAPLTINPTP